jgi:hypothetical protein
MVVQAKAMQLELNLKITGWVSDCQFVFTKPGRRRWPRHFERRVRPEIWVDIEVSTV